MKDKFIKPYHLFTHRGNWFLINIEGMLSASIAEATAAAIKTIPAVTGSVLEPSTQEQLKKLELISEGRWQAKRRKAVKHEPVPIVNVALFLTQSCNLKCIYCYEGNRKYEGGNSMDQRTAFQAVDWLIYQSGKTKKLQIGFFGGEPFLNFPLMKAVVEYTKKRIQGTEKEVNFHVTTNATLLSDEKIAFIKEHNILVMISFDGPKEVQDAQRPFVNGEGSYDSTLPKIKKLLEVLPKTPGHAIITTNSNPQLIKDALQEIGFSEVTLTLASASLFDGDSGKIAPGRDIESMLSWMEEEAETWISYSKNRNKEVLNKLMSTGRLYQAILAFLHNSKRYYPCGAGLESVGISCSGDVYLCHRFVGLEKYKLGNVFNQHLDREEYLKSPLTCSEACGDCFAKYYCAGGCKHDNAGSMGSISTPAQDICLLKRREIELAAYISCTLNDQDRAFLIEHNIFPPKPCPLDFG